MPEFLFVGGPLHGRAMVLPDNRPVWMVPVARPLSMEYRETPHMISAVVEEARYDRTKAEVLGQQAEVYVIKGGRINELLERAVAQWLSTTGIRIFP